MIGKTLNHYKIISQLGSGGMGEVYLAEDASLDRQVALKVLPSDLASDPERRQRFEREAKAIAAIDHPNIVTVFSVEEADGIHFITMQLVEGKTLSELIPCNGFPLEKFFDLAVPLADAISAAHDQGIVHRDLKPSNIMVSDDGRVRVLDFGLAKLKEETAAVEAGSALATEGEPEPLTEEGKILGTVAYMSPEQAEGKPVDHGTDIFSLGIILYEMATGERPFKGDTKVSLISSIVKETPTSITELNRNLPRHLGRITKRALAKDVEHRFQSAKDLRNDLKELKEEVVSGELVAGSMAADASRPPWQRILPRALLAAFPVIAAGVVIWALQSGGFGPAPSVEPQFWTIVTPEGTDQFAYPVAISPDGSTVAFIALGTDAAGGETRQIYTHVLAERDAGPLLGTEDLDLRGDFHTLFFSPDGTSLGFATDEGVYRVELDGRSRPQRLCDAPHFRGASWGPDDTIIYAPTQFELVRISASTVPCEPEILVQGDSRPSAYLSYRSPHHLPGGRALLAMRRTVETGIWGGEVVLLDLDTGEERWLIEGSGAVYVEPGYLMFGQRDSIVAAPFDLEKLSLLGRATPLAGMDRLEVRFRHQLESLAMFAASRTGDLVYQQGAPPRTVTLALTGPDGEPEILDLQPPLELASANRREVSRDGTQFLFTGGNGIWVYPMNPPGPGRRLGFPDSHDSLATWTPDGESIVFGSDHLGTVKIYLQVADGTREPELLVDTMNGTPCDFSDDGNLLLYMDQGETTGRDMWIYDRRSGELRLLADDPGHEQCGTISHDGRYFAYSLSGVVHVESVVDGAYVASWQGGNVWRWGPGSRYLEFQRGRSDWVRASVKEGSDIEFADLEPTPGPPYGGVLADGRTLERHSSSPQQVFRVLKVIRDFSQEIIRQVPRKR